MIAVGVAIAAVVGGAGVGWLAVRRHARRRAAHDESMARFDPVARKVIETARRLARVEAFGRPSGARRTGKIWPVHIVAALLEAEPFAVALEAIGGSPAAVKKRVDVELESPSLGPPKVPVIGRVLARAAASKRSATCTHLWLALSRTNAAALVEVPPVTVNALSFWLVHGRTEPPIVATDGELDVVMHNDDFTILEFVISALREVFGLDHARAEALARATHEQGRAVVGRYPGSVAAGKVAEVRALARREGHPLYLTLEP